MRCRAQDADGDYTFGQGSANFLVDSPAAVGQLVQTRLELWQGEWFLDRTEGTPYGSQVLGYASKKLYDLAIRSRIIGTLGVTGIAAYASSIPPGTRALEVTATIDTRFGQAQVQQSIAFPIFGG